jgi:hypothetical protein
VACRRTAATTAALVSPRADLGLPGGQGLVDQGQQQGQETTPERPREAAPYDYTTLRHYDNLDDMFNRDPQRPVRTGNLGDPRNPHPLTSRIRALMGANYFVGREPFLSPGLAAQSVKWSEMSLQSATRPNSVLQQLAPSPVAANLSAPSQSGRELRNGFILPNYSNGSAQNASETESFLKQQIGDDNEMMSWNQMQIRQDDGRKVLFDRPAVPAPMNTRQAFRVNALGQSIPRPRWS